MLNMLLPFDLLSICQALGVQAVGAQSHSSFNAARVALNAAAPISRTRQSTSLFFLFGTEEQMLTELNVSFSESPAL
jgi:hypothetical protein